MDDDDAWLSRRYSSTDEMYDESFPSRPDPTDEPLDPAWMLTGPSEEWLGNGISTALLELKQIQKEFDEIGSCSPNISEHHLVWLRTSLPVRLLWYCSWYTGHWIHFLLRRCDHNAPLILTSRQRLTGDQHHLLVTIFVQTSDFGHFLVECQKSVEQLSVFGRRVFMRSVGAGRRL